MSSEQVLNSSCSPPPSRPFFPSPERAPPSPPLLQSSATSPQNSPLFTLLFFSLIAPVVQLTDTLPAFPLGFLLPELALALLFQVPFFHSHDKPNSLTRCLRDASPDNFLPSPPISPRFNPFPSYSLASQQQFVPAAGATSY